MITSWLTEVDLQRRGGIYLEFGFGGTVNAKGSSASRGVGFKLNMLNLRKIYILLLTAILILQNTLNFKKGWDSPKYDSSKECSGDTLGSGKRC